MSSQTRPEHVAPPDIFYGDDEAKKYAAKSGGRRQMGERVTSDRGCSCSHASSFVACFSSSRMIEIQSTMARRAIELLTLHPNEQAHILDIGCGSGLSGEVLSEAGYSWTGVDIAPAMLGVAVKREVEGPSGSWQRRADDR